MGTVPQPRQWNVGDLVTAAEMNGISAALNFVLTQEGFNIHSPSPTSIANATNTTVDNTLAGWTVDLDRSNGGINAATGIIPISAGFWTISGYLEWGASTAGVRQIMMWGPDYVTAPDTSFFNAADDQYGRQPFSRLIYVPNDSSIYFQVAQNSGVALNLNAWVFAGVRLSN